jgi:serine/threonine protein kinase
VIEANIYFTKIKEIGNDEGKNSETFLANDIQLNTELVVKQIDKSTFLDSSKYFLESRMLYDCKHINIMEIQYASQDEDYIYLSMPYYKNGSLSKLIDTRYLSCREIVKYSLDLLSGVAYIHSKDLIHLDIKPTNILIDHSNRAVLTDFGLSKYLDCNGIADQPYNYKFHLDPEYFLRSGRTKLSDIYQIGLTLYRLCNGNNILQSQYASLNPTLSDANLAPIILSGKFPNRDYFLPHIPNKLKNIIKKSLKLNTNDRYNNVIEIMNDLSDIDENLDWIYTGNPSELYYLVDEKNKITISTVNNKGNTEIKCTKENLNTGRIINMNKYCSTGYTSEKAVLSEIAKIIKDI